MTESTDRPIHRLTDKEAIKVALWLAIDTENSLIDAYRDQHTGTVPDHEPGVQIARRRIAAFQRVLDRYYGGARSAPLPGGKPVSIYKLMTAPDRNFQ